MTKEGSEVSNKSKEFQVLYEDAKSKLIKFTVNHKPKLSCCDLMNLFKNIIRLKEAISKQRETI